MNRHGLTTLPIRLNGQTSVEIMTDSGSEFRHGDGVIKHSVTRIHCTRLCLCTVRTTTLQHTKRHERSRITGESTRQNCAHPSESTEFSASPHKQPSVHVENLCVFCDVSSSLLSTSACPDVGTRSPRRRLSFWMRKKLQLPAPFRTWLLGQRWCCQHGDCSAPISYDHHQTRWQTLVTPHQNCTPPYAADDVLRSSLSHTASAH